MCFALHSSSLRRWERARWRGPTRHESRIIRAEWKARKAWHRGPLSLPRPRCQYQKPPGVPPLRCGLLPRQVEGCGEVTTPTHTHTDLLSLRLQAGLGQPEPRVERGVRKELVVLPGGGRGGSGSEGAFTWGSLNFELGGGHWVPAGPAACCPCWGAAGAALPTLPSWHCNCRRRSVD